MSHDMKCTDVMTKDPVCCVPSDTAEKVARIMKAKDVGPIPVVSDLHSKKIVGIVTDRDIALKVVAEGRDPKKTKIESIETSDVVLCHPDDDIQEVLDAMKEHQIRRIPVVDDNNRLIGIIAQADVATCVDEPESVAETVKEISKPHAPLL